MWSAKLFLKASIFFNLENKGWISFFLSITFCDLAILSQNGNVTKRWCTIFQKEARNTGCNSLLLMWQRWLVFLECFSLPAFVFWTHHTRPLLKLTKYLCTCHINISTHKISQMAHPKIKVVQSQKLGGEGSWFKMKPLPLVYELSVIILNPLKFK